VPSAVPSISVVGFALMRFTEERTVQFSMRKKKCEYEEYDDEMGKLGRESMRGIEYDSI
jgi:hypothetical protein